MAQVFRVERNKNFTVMSNHHFENKDLLLKAKGLLSLMLKHGRPIMPAGVNSFLKNIVNAYNKKANWQKKRSESRS